MQKKQAAKQQTKQNEAKTAKAQGGVANPSEKLANLLRKEAMLSGRVLKAKADLQNVQTEIQEMWEARTKQAEELLDDGASGGG